MSSVLFLLNDRSEFDFSDLIAKHLPEWRVEVATEFPDRPSLYQLIVPWNYRKIIRDIPVPNNVVVFHSSDLPEGKGWAPIYYAIAEDRPYHVVSGILVSLQVDGGDVVVKARFRILPGYTAPILRRFDVELSIMAARKILQRFPTQAIAGVPQTGTGSYRKRRSPDDNRIDTSRRFSELIPQLRACEPSAPAFFDYNGVRYVISVSPVTTPSFPDDVEFHFPQDAHAAG